MKITDIKVITVEDDDRLKAFVTVEFEKYLVIRDFKVIRGERGNFVAMPSKRMKDGSFKDLVYAANPDARKYIEESVLEEYEAVLGGGHSHVA
ncbi:MAG: septation protein SpoVG family protein [Deltaproteobacteria bacterium]|nr:septation protein SpoVG family protein [Deltaproteobacteria bacterium]